jgi:small subunit ribosomal protein S2
MTLDGTIEKLTKKERLQIEREIEKMKKVFAGIQEMKKIPSAIFVIDIKKEEIAVREALKLRIPIFAVVDTNCDPTEIDYPIPGNDDSTKSVTIISRIMADAVLEGRESIKAKAIEEEEMAVKQEKTPKMSEKEAGKEESGKKSTKAKEKPAEDKATPAEEKATAAEQKKEPAAAKEKEASSEKKEEPEEKQEKSEEKKDTPAEKK